MLEPQGTGMTFSYWRWAVRSERQLETTILSYLKQLTNFDLALPPTPSPDVIRDHIDDLVKDPSAPSAAFLLVKDYEHLLYQGDESDDLKRIARLVADPRLTDFQILNNALRKQVPPVLIDAIVRRLTRLENLDDDQIMNLQATVAKLPNGALANADPAAVFDNPRLSRRAEKLMPRLAEEGPSAAPKFLNIIKAGFAQPDRKDHLWGHEILHAATGLCRLGSQASSVLPELIEIQEQQKNSKITRDLKWRAALLSLGHPISALPPPDNWS
ncbi:MAG: hypothetical protein FJW36_08135 [Acidobacteria bacterium]|nr:hypothetical protein [Acidobacteriota bacterium]